MRDTKLTTKERRVISFAEQYFHEVGKAPSVIQVADKLRMSSVEVEYALENKAVRIAFLDRGIPWVGELSKGALEPIQVAAAMAVTNFGDPRSIDQKLKDIGVSEVRYQGWMNQPNFKRYVRILGDKVLGNVRHEALANFARKVREGNLHALKYYFEVMGEFQAQELMDRKLFVNRVLEAILRHVTDDQVLQAITNEISSVDPHVTSLSNAHQIAQTPAVVYDEEEFLEQQLPNLEREEARAKAEKEEREKENNMGLFGLLS